MPNSYWPGQLISLDAAFLTNGTTATDPTTITLIVRNPAGVETSYTAGFSHPTTGNYAYNYDLTNALSGIWWYRYVGTGSAQAANENSFWVHPSNF
jgi:hypothetical protein